MAVAISRSKSWRHVLPNVFCALIALSHVALAQEASIPAIAIVEKGGPSADTLVASWTKFRTNWPNRPFCVVKVRGQCTQCAQGEIGNLLIPKEMALDPKVNFFTANRDRDDQSQQSDWSDLCSKQITGATTVALLVDLPVAQVQASYNYFLSSMTQIGKKIALATPSGNLNYIEPFDRIFLSPTQSPTNMPTTLRPTASPTPAPTPLPIFNFNRVSFFPACRQLDSTCRTDTVTSAEILTASPDGMTLIYTDGPQDSLGFVNIKDPYNPTPLGILAVKGEPTSVTVVKGYLVACVDTSTDFVNPKGLLHVIDIDTRTILRSMDLAGQPDSIATSPDQRFVAIVIENQRDESKNSGNLPQLPGGFIQVLNTQNANFMLWSLTTISLLGPGGTGLPGLTEPTDPEPEYASINSNNICVVTLQENNAIVLINLETSQVTASFSAGLVNLTNIDTVRDQVIFQNPNGGLQNLPREPDGVTWIDLKYFATTDEGDWKGGTRGFTVFDTTGRIVYTSGAELETLATQLGHYPERRANAKGNEPENLAFGIFKGTPFLFVNSERSSLVFVYDVSNPEKPIHKQTLPVNLSPEGVKTIPSRNLVVVASEVDDRASATRGGITIYQYQESLPLYPTLLSARDSVTGNPIPFGALSGLAAAKPLSGGSTRRLRARVLQPGVMDQREIILYSCEDSFYRSNRIFQINATNIPAVITNAMNIRDSDNVFLSKLTAINNPAIIITSLINADKTVNIDSEGIAVSKTGGFWLAHEGGGTVNDTANRVTSPNLLFKLSSTAVITEVVLLPAAVNNIQVRFGFEGVAEDGNYVVVIFQRAWLGEIHPRIGIYNTVTTLWKFVFYTLNQPESQFPGGFVGLSDIAPLGKGRFIVVERDNRGGDDAAIKELYVIDLGDFSMAEGTIISKQFLFDLMPRMAAYRGAQIEKVEGVAVTSNGDVFINTDNDGVNSNSGEQLFINLGLLKISPFTPISAIQGITDSSPFKGQTVTVEAIVVGDFQNGDADNSRNLGGFYIQEEDSDTDENPLTSEGIFVFEGTSLIIDVALGDLVQVTGIVAETFGQTQISATKVTVISSGNPLPTPATISFPLTPTLLESFEGMRVIVTNSMVITEMFNLDRFNEITVATSRFFQYTQTDSPSKSGFAAHTINVAANSITYDDGLASSNADINLLDGFGPNYNTSNTPRMGDTITGLAGVLTFSFSAWRIRSPRNGTNRFIKSNPRPASPPSIPSLPGTMKMASFNVLNFFITLGSRGADNIDEYNRQLQKLKTALTALNADIFALLEIENDFGSTKGAPSALKSLTEALGSSYDYVWPGTQKVGSDAISVAFIYKPAVLSIDDIKILTDTNLPTGSPPTPIFTGENTNRPALAVTFKAANGECVTVAANHFKSKGGTGPGENADKMDGAGSWNKRRLDAAISVNLWLKDLSRFSCANQAIVGDLNAYSMEEPITYLTSQAGFISVESSTDYSYVFDGQIGTLDYILLNPALNSKKKGAGVWHICEDEPDAIDYNLNDGRPVSYFDGTSPARASDHSPILVGLDLSKVTSCAELSITGVLDGPLSGGTPKVIELYASSSIADLSKYCLETPTNGAIPTPNFCEFTFPSASVPAGTYIHVATTSADFNTFFTFVPTYVDGVASINGNDAVVLKLTASKTIVDFFGEEVDGTGRPWEYTDGWAYRKSNTQAGVTFNAVSWTFSGIDALDAAPTNAAATKPFPIRTYTCS